MRQQEFGEAFAALTDNPPFPWQWELYQRFLSGSFPRSCNLPTGLGKTSVIHLWLLALAHAPREVQVPRRLVYVVNRRTVVDQSTDEARKLRMRIDAVPRLRELLCGLCASPTSGQTPLAISTLRGQFADNREWSADPARPAVIAGTVDMIGSRLLFSGYGCGFKSRPLHAGFLGQDALLVHDEAHLEPAFQALITAVEQEQRHGRTPDVRPLRVMELTATSRGEGGQFRLSPADYDNQGVARRVRARKGITFHEIADEKKTAEKIATLALGHKDSGQAVLVFASTLEAVNRVAEPLRKEFKKDAETRVQLLTGVLRGFERDRLTTHDPVFARFLPVSNRPGGVKPTDGTVYLICTSAGEVGVNISADTHMICDLTSFESMAQRFGRVNRFGSGDACIDIVHPATFDTKEKPRELARERTLGLLRRLRRRVDGRHDASPHALGELPAGERQEAFSPPPRILPTSDILFDAWALTSIREPLPGRPPVADYLHGVDEGEPPQTCVAWREEVALVSDSGLSDRELGDVLEDYPLKPHELLRDRSDRVAKHLALLAQRHADAKAWLVDDDGGLETTTLAQLAEDKDRINGRTVVLPPAVGGLRDGALDGTAHQGDSSCHDVADEWADDQGPLRRRATVPLGTGGRPLGMRQVAAVALTPPAEEAGAEPVGDEAEPPVRLVRLFYVRVRAGDDDGSKLAGGQVKLATHHEDTQTAGECLGRQLLPEAIRGVAGTAGRFHDLGKDRDVWQRSVGNTDGGTPLAKSGTAGSLRGLNNYRHEFGSLLDIEKQDPFRALSPDEQDLVLHLLAAHHGRGRPHFPAEEAFDPERGEKEAARVAGETSRRFARLQRRYGRWGLAWLESLLRAADAEASANPGEVQDG